MKNVKVGFWKIVLLSCVLFWTGCQKKNVIRTDDDSDTTPPTVTITTPTGGTTISGVVTITISASDNVGVASVELYVDGRLNATDNSSPWEFTWDTSSYTDGNYSLSVKAYDDVGNVGTSSSITVTVKNSLDLTFNNQVFTDIELTVTGQPGTHMITPGGSLTLTYSTNPGSITYHAETSGHTTTGSQVGKKINWDYTHNVAGESSKTYNLVLTSEWFFIYIQNTGTQTLTPFYVNYGTVDQTIDHISIPPDGVKYRTGYYKAFTNTEVRAYWNNTSQYTYWIQGVHFTLPFTNNQSITLKNTFLQKNTNQENKELISNNQNSALLIPAESYSYNFKYVDDAIADCGKGVD